jgi:hypothetical protein
LLYATDGGHIERGESVKEKEKEKEKEKREGCVEEGYAMSRFTPHIHVDDVVAVYRPSPSAFQLLALLISTRYAFVIGTSGMSRTS